MLNEDNIETPKTMSTQTSTSPCMSLYQKTISIPSLISVFQSNHSSIEFQMSKLVIMQLIDDSINCIHNGIGNKTIGDIGNMVKRIQFSASGNKFPYHDI